MYQKVSTNLNFVEREKKTEKFWEENDIFKKSMEHRKEGETYTFYDGPPTANGKPHIGHVLTRVRQDGILMDSRLSWKLRSFLDWTGKNRLRNTVWSRLLVIVKTVYGNTKECGKTSQKQSDTGLIWRIHTLLMIIILSNLNGGH